jgi:hypothetical protein
VARRIAAIDFELGVRYDDSRARLDMVTAEWCVIACVRDDRNISIPVGLKYVGIVGIGGATARNCRIVRLHKRLVPLQNRGIDRCPLPQIAGRSASGSAGRTSCEWTSDPGQP